MVLGPNALLVAARIDLRDDLDGDRVERASTEIDHRLRELVPDVTEVFLDATPAREFSEVVSEQGGSRSRWVRCERPRSSGRFPLRAERQKAGIRRAIKLKCHRAPAGLREARCHSRAVSRRR
jgi:hypothetical protein